MGKFIPQWYCVELVKQINADLDHGDILLEWQLQSSEKFFRPSYCIGAVLVFIYNPWKKFALDSNGKQAWHIEVLAIEHLGDFVEVMFGQHGADVVASGDRPN